MRRLPALFCLGLWAVGCVEPEGPCADGEEVVNGSCQPIEVEDSGDEPGDSGTSGPAEGFSEITVDFEITRLPNDLTVELACAESGGEPRTLFSEDNFTFFTSRSESAQVTPGETCTATFTDARGGELPGGSIKVCSEVVATFEAARIEPDAVRRVTDIEAIRCTPGCVDPVAENFDAEANLDDGTCRYIEGCTDPEAENFDAGATRNDGTCDYGGFGPLRLTVFTDDGPRDTVARIFCRDVEILSFQSGGTAGTWSSWSSYARTTVVDAGFECEVEIEDLVGDEGPSGAVSICDERVLSWGRIPASDLPYKVRVGSFRTGACSGCTDPVASNFDTGAVVDDGSCTYP